VEQVIEFKNVSKIYGDGTKAVEDLSLKINDGELVVFIGTSGSGKTTSMRMLNRMVEPTEGEIEINGKNIADSNAVDLRRKIGYVIQQTGLMPHMTVYENIIMVPRLLKWDDKKMEETARRLLEQVNMDPDEFLDRYPSELSGGQQQRIGVIRALAADQEIILMDEPFGALDPITRDALQDLVLELQKEMGRTVIFVTHDMDEALNMADKVAIMSKGQLIQYDTPENIISNPANEFVKEFIGDDRMIQTSLNQTVEEVMIKTPVTIDRGTSLANTVKVMKGKRVDSVFVTDDNNVLHGVVDFELINRGSRGKTVDDVMILPDFYVKPDALLRDVTERMLKRDLQNVVVLSDGYHLEGLLTRTSLVDVVYESIWGNEEDEASSAGIQSLDPDELKSSIDTADTTTEVK